MRNPTDRQILCAFLCALLLDGCSGKSPHQITYDRYQPWIGRSITDFTAETGQIPDDAFNNEHDERVFIFRNQLGPGTCRVIKTRQEGKAFRIVQIDSWCP